MFGWVRNIGLIVILFAAWQLWGTSIETHHAQASLRTQFASAAAGVAVPHGPGSSSTRVPSPPHRGRGWRGCRSPRIGVDQFVVEGTAAADLAKGPGHYIGTAMPGQQGNIAIAGHRTTYGAPFNRLDELKVGDKVVLTTSMRVKRSPTSCRRRPWPCRRATSSCSTTPATTG